MEYYSPAVKSKLMSVNGSETPSLHLSVPQCNFISCFYVVSESFCIHVHFFMASTATSIALQCEVVMQLSHS